MVGGTPEAAVLGRALEAVARDLARQQAADGEGATTVILTEVSGALDDAEARAVARAVVSSSLVKAAVHGRDPNWGRIAAAAGNARLADAAVLDAAGMERAEASSRAGRPAIVDPDRLRISIAGQLVFDGHAAGPSTISSASDAWHWGGRVVSTTTPAGARMTILATVCGFWLGFSGFLNLKSATVPVAVPGVVAV